MTRLSHRPTSPVFTRFFGRTRELAAIGEAFVDAPIVTLVGPPGIGKTRLAAEWVRTACAGAVVVDLSVARRADDVLHALASALGCAPSDLTAAIAARDDLTLVLDNAEGCREALGEVLSRMATPTTDLRALVTSRMRLGIDAERVVPVGGLAPDDGGRALFVDRARALRPSLSADEDGVVELVGALDGVPLAIELAAARALLLSPSELLARVRTSALDTLVRTVGGADSMRARYEWSLALLSDAEREALTSLAAIDGACSVDDAEAMTGSLAVVEALREHHLLRQTEDGSLALYAGVRDLLAEPSLRARAFDRWATHLARRASLAVADPSDAVEPELFRLDRQARPVLDVLVARSCGQPGDAEHASALFCALARSRRLRGPLADVAALGETLVGLAALDGRARVAVVTHLGVCLAEANTARARTLLEEAGAAATAAGDRTMELFAGMHLGVVYTRTGEIGKARALVDALRDRADDAASLARLSHVSSGVALREGDLERAYGDIEAAIIHARRVPSSSGVARAELAAGLVCVERGRFDRATTHLLASLVACEAVGDHGTACMARSFLAEVRLHEGDVKEAIVLYQATAIEAARIGLGVIGAYAVVCRGFAHLLAGHLALADADFAEGRELLQSFDEPGDTALADAGRACVARLRDDERCASFVAAVGTPTGGGIAALLSFADGVPRRGPFASPGPRVASFVAERLGAGGIAEHAAPILTLLPTGFVVEGQPDVNLVGRHRLLAIVRALATAHGGKADGFVSRAKLVAAAWPGERILEAAAANRLKVALSTLRKLGLPLDSVAAGVRIAAGTSVRIVGFTGS